MAAPNLNNPTKVEAKFVHVAATTTGVTVLTCPSDTVLRIVSLTADNVDGTDTANVSLEIDGDPFKKTIAVPANASLLLVDKDYPLYLTDGLELEAFASADGDIVINCSYEEIT
jgi:hypothetical protein